MKQKQIIVKVNVDFSLKRTEICILIFFWYKVLKEKNTIINEKMAWTKRNDRSKIDTSLNITSLWYGTKLFWLSLRLIPHTEINETFWFWKSIFLCVMFDEILILF